MTAHTFAPHSILFNIHLWVVNLFYKDVVVLSEPESKYRKGQIIKSFLGDFYILSNSYYIGGKYFFIGKCKVNTPIKLPIN